MRGEDSRLRLSCPSEMYFFYSLLYCVAALVLLPREYFRRPAEIRRRWLKDKLGFTSVRRTGQEKRLIWIHAVSVGEVLSTVPFLRELRKRHPDFRFVLSTITDTGQKVARERLSAEADIIYLPFDVRACINQAFRRIKPDLFITVETEFWPNIIRFCRTRRIPIHVLNGRLSEPSFKGYRLIRFFMAPVLRKVDRFCMQDEVYAARLIALGAEKEQVRVIGSFKFDTKPSGAVPEWTSLLSSPVLVAGSTHEGEEELMLDLYDGLRKDFPDITLILAPRHPERLSSVENLVRQRGVPFINRTQLTTPQKGAVIILDTMGELASVYGACDVALIGGSFAAYGGHNPLEPAFWQKPIVCGPHMDNFPFIAEFYNKRAAVQTRPEETAAAVNSLLRSSEKRVSMGSAAVKLFREKSGAVEKALKELECYF